MAERVRLINVEEWEPKTLIGRKVKAGEITSLEEIKRLGKPILEPEIIDALFPSLEAETLEVRTTQRVTDSGKRMKFRVVKVIGDRRGHVGLGVGKSEELKPAMDYAIRNAKKNMTTVRLGCGSWECQCSYNHSIPFKVVGKEGSTVVTLMPAPRGLGLAANDIVKKVLSLAGVSDVWSTTVGGGRNIWNTASATLKAIEKLNTFKE